MSKWDNKKDTLYPEQTTQADKPKPDIESERKERIVEWTFQLANTMISTNRWTISAIPATAYNLAKEIDAYLQSVGYLPKSLEEK